MKEAQKVFELVVQEDPLNYEAMNNLGAVLYMSGEIDDAEKWFHKTLSVKDGDPDALVNLADLYVKQKRWTEAASILERYLRDDPSNTNSLNQLALVYLESGKPDRAIPILQKSLEIQSDQEDIRNVLEAITLKPKGERKEIMFNEVYFDISGVCNARCRYCINGGKNSLSGPQHRLGAGQIDVLDFEKAINYMLGNNIIGNSSVIHLYNWGEPFLHPRFKEIISILNNNHLHFGLSTNASRPTFFNDDEALSGLDGIIFSMPGFSQASYDRIHGFDFELIKKNIRDMVTNYRENGFKGMAQISYHLYQFNFWEIFKAKEFAQKLNIGINFSTAYFNGYSMFRNYLMDKMDYAQLKISSTELLTFYIKDLIKKRPTDYICPQYAYLVLDEYCNVLTCCAVDRLTDAPPVGKLFDLSPEEIQQKKWNKRFVWNAKAWDWIM
jgi:tetratricopeptide (TPR) repeat protein